MDLHLKQWSNQHGSEHEHSAKMPKLVLGPHQNPQLSASALSLFVPETTANTKVSTLSAFSDSTFPNTRLNPRMGSYFSLAQWQELELQALIFRYILAGAAVPPELLQPIKKSLLHSPTYFLHQPLQEGYPPFLQSGYWGRAAMDPEPGRCRRTDGKKWRCSRDVVAGQKYCERHMHRGRNRSRKPVELPTPTTAPGGGGSLGATTTSISAPSLATASLKSPFDLHHLNQSSLGAQNDECLLENQDNVVEDGRSDGHLLRHFFDDWPRSLQEPDNNNAENNSTSATCLSISMPGNTSSDVSLKLATGNGSEETCPRNECVGTGQPQLNWGAGGGWNSSSQVASMGGPLAEALRSSSASTSWPTSVLHHQLARASASEASFIST